MHRGQRAQHAVDPDRLRRDRPARRRLPRPRGQRVRQDDRARATARPQRVPVGLLRAGRLPRAARHHRSAVARHDDGAVLRQGIPAEHHAPGDCVSRCSGTPSTSSGSAFSPTSISGDAAHERAEPSASDAAPGEGGDFGEHSVAESVRNYVIGLVLAAVLTVASFWVASGTAFLYGPGRADGTGGAGGRPDGRPPRLLPAHHHRRRTTPTTCSRSPSAC